jgi:hypothetical protein
MKISQDIRDEVSKQNHAEVFEGMQKMSEVFREKGSEIYLTEDKG